MMETVVAHLSTTRLFLVAGVCRLERVSPSLFMAPGLGGPAATPLSLLSRFLLDFPVESRACVSVTVRRARCFCSNPIRSDSARDVVVFSAKQQRVSLCQQFMSNGGFAAIAALLTKQATRLERQARARAEARATAAERARRAQLAQAEARQAQQAAMLAEDDSLMGRSLPGRRVGGPSGSASSPSLQTSSSREGSGVTAASVAAGDDGGGSGGGGPVSGAGGIRGISDGSGGGGVGDASASSRAAELAAKAVEAVEAAVAANAALESAAAAAAAAAAQGEQWLGSEPLAILLGAVADCLVEQPPSAVHIAMQMCNAVMIQVEVLSEEELKKENQDVSCLQSPLLVWT